MGRWHRGARGQTKWAVLCGTVHGKKALAEVSTNPWPGHRVAKCVQSTPSQSTRNRTRSLPDGSLGAHSLTKQCCTQQTPGCRCAPLVHKHTHTCILAHSPILLTDPLHPVPAKDSSHHLFTSGKINPSESSWHCLPLQGEGLLPPLLCLVFGFQSSQGVNTASLKS